VCKILKTRKGPRNSRWKLDLDPETMRIGKESKPYKPEPQKGGRY
jgi:hypothetical protein